MKMGIGWLEVNTGRGWLGWRLSAGNGFDWCQTRIQDFGTHPSELDRDRHLLTTAKGVGDFTNPEAGMDDLIAYVPASTRGGPGLTATYGIGGGRRRLISVHASEPIEAPFPPERHPTGLWEVPLNQNLRQLREKDRGHRRFAHAAP